jgi:FlaA1/EpsC-like NDP-sugar epimerase
MSQFRRKFYLIVFDFVCIYISLLLGVFIRFHGNIPYELRELALIHGIYISFIFILFFWSFGLYKNLWQYGGLGELFQITLSSITSTIICLFAEIIFQTRLPESSIIISAVIIILLLLSTRIIYRSLRNYSKRKQMKKPVKKTMVIGAGDAGIIILREMKNNSNVKNSPVIFIDDDKAKIGCKIQGVRIVGNTETIPQNVVKYNIEEIIFAIPSANNQDKKRILQICSKTGCRILVMSPIEKQLKGISFLRPVRIEDLLGRLEVNLDISSISSYLSNKTVLITGGGGSIGSEIARQIMGFNIKKLVLLDNYENNVFYLVHELRINYGSEVNIEIAIASIRDRDRLEEIFKTYKPDVVFHAAAHKHVPLMEKNPSEAVKNNIFGTFNLVDLSDEYHVEKFILISTDKAVNPTSVMGATKRIAEMIVQAINKRSNTVFSAVRFGNVLGSNGSVIPLFKKQIEAGGPITITDPEIKRYFMTPSEASQLVIQSGAIAKGGEIFILDMGEQIKIIDLAKNLITLSGLIPEQDIKIEIVGLRPGEKLFEELMHKDSCRRTSNDRIFIEDTCKFSFEEIVEKITDLMEISGNSNSIKEAIAKIVPQYDYKKDSIR